MTVCSHPEDGEESAEETSTQTKQFYHTVPYRSGVFHCTQVVAFDAVPGWLHLTPYPGGHV